MSSDEHRHIAAKKKGIWSSSQKGLVGIQGVFFKEELRGKDFLNMKSQEFKGKD